MSTSLPAEAVELVAEFLAKHPLAPQGAVSCLATALRSYERNLAYHKEHHSSKSVRQYKEYLEKANSQIEELRQQQQELLARLVEA